MRNECDDCDECNGTVNVTHESIISLCERKRAVSVTSREAADRIVKGLFPARGIFCHGSFSPQIWSAHLEPKTTSVVPLC